MAKWLNKIYPGDAVVEDEPLRRRLIKGRYLASIIVFIIVFGLALVVYLAFSAHVLQTNLPGLKTAHIDTMVVKSRRAQVAIQVTFEVPSAVKASPQLGTFVLSTARTKNVTLRAVVDSKYNISGKDQLIVLEFENPGLLSDKERTWMWLVGDFKMHVKPTYFPLVPKVKRHAKFFCDVLFHYAQLHNQRCYVTYPVLSRSWG